MFHEVVQQAFLLVFLFSLLPLLGSSIAGLGVSIVQVATQIQEQSITFFVKLIAVGGVLTVAADWYIRTLLDYTAHIFEYIALLGRM